MKNNILMSLNLNFHLIKIFLFGFVAFISCSSDKEDPIVVEPPSISKPSFAKVASILRQSPKGDYVMVMAHRGGFVSTPENSISGIKNSIDLGVDIVELDVQLTKDRHLVIMHDATISRTTNGTGLVSDYTLAELKQFKLLMPNGAVSNEFIPSLKEVLAYSKGKMHLFIDKGDDYLDLVYADMLATSTIEQTIMGGVMTFATYKSKFPLVWDKINYIPRAGTGQSLNYISEFEDGISPVGYFPSCGLISANSDVFKKIKDTKKWMFSETLKGGGSNNCSEIVFGGETIWSWEIEQGIDGIFTDLSKELVEYLKKNGLHNNE